MPRDIEPGAEGLEQYKEQLVAAIKSAIRDSTPLITINPKFSHKGFNDQCQTAIQQIRKARRMLSLLAKADPESAEYQEAKHKFHQIRNEKNRLIKRVLRQTHRDQMAETTGNLLKTWQVSKWNKNKANPFKPFTPTLKTSSGIVTTKEGKVNVFARTLFPTPPEADLKRHRWIYLSNADRYAGN